MAPLSPPRSGRSPGPSSQADSEPEAGAVTAALGANLRRLRLHRGLSLERLARASGVSRAMLGQIELGQSAPTIRVLWKIATCLEVPFSALLSGQRAPGPVVLRAGDAKVLHSASGTFRSRALFPFDERRRVEFYELWLAPRSEERAEGHAAGTMENLVVTEGGVEIEAAKRRELLGPGDSVTFEADVPHVYRNPTGVAATMFLVMLYADAVG